MEKQPTLEMAEESHSRAFEILIDCVLCSIDLTSYVDSLEAVEVAEVAPKTIV